MKQRRNFIAGLVASGVIPSWVMPSAWAQSKKPRVDKVLWGGLGFSVRQDQVEKRFPLVNQAINNIGFPKLVSAFTDRLAKNYPAGLEDNPKNMIDANSDPSLLFTVSLDYEQMIIVPSDGGGQTEFQLSFVYALAQVLYFDLPRPGGSEGEIRILYSFPFRVSSGDTPRINQVPERIRNIQNLLTTLDNSLVNVFARKVATKKFREGTPPKRLKVRNVTITPEAASVINSLGIADALNQDFFGQAFTASVAEQGDLSMLPYMQNNTMGELARRFNQFPNISQVFQRFSNMEENDYIMDLTVFRALRQSNGGNIGNVLYARGMSVFVKVMDANRNNQVIFDKKILLIENNELPKAMFDKLKDYDLRYMVQIAIKMFDVFVAGVMKEDKAMLKSVGLDPDKDMAEVKALKEVWLKCRYAS